jgi:hypothetical protein
MLSGVRLGLARAYQQESITHVCGKRFVLRLHNIPQGSGRASRKPTLLFRFDGVSLFRWAERRFCPLLFQDPPR